MLHQIQHLLVSSAPKILRHPAQLMPFSVQKKVMLESLALVFKEAIEDGDFEFLEGKWLKVEVRDLNLVWHISSQQGKLVMAEQCVAPDVTFSAELNDLILIAGRKEDPDTLFFQRRLCIEGDTELGLEIKNLIGAIEFDNFPSSLTVVLDKFSSFVQQGLTPLSNNEMNHQYVNQNRSTS
ncbi:SCP2 domain-containing protein [Vibrio sp. SS-MA-C1-2]|uniref:ubiquinone anaerobic biosynthesis accessory factor UbiT n=1 Tax=Vibrio sp. SS-MA-C1-2 TaxID=2908646 RepID=UPI001F3B7D9D|nr:SCP2 domain-containing protein [Vibrio sp. SS-MA-C1-2]UJF19707.1 SCP2 domain-containing protein [Vibrio sp. SS-MA-C1-2]